MQVRLAYAIEFVADMDRAIAFYRDTLGLKLRFASPEWTEFETGEVTLALHAAGLEKTPGMVQLGFAVADLEDAYAKREATGLVFVAPPENQHGTLLARILGPEGSQISLSTPAQ